jgi:hypothetical protein
VFKWIKYLNPVWWYRRLRWEREYKEILASHREAYANYLRTGHIEPPARKLPGCWNRNTITASEPEAHRVNPQRRKSEEREEYSSMADCIPDISIETLSAFQVEGIYDTPKLVDLSPNHGQWLGSINESWSGGGGAGVTSDWDSSSNSGSPSSD